MQNGKTDKEDGDDFSKQERLEKLASFQLMMIKHAMKCECHGPPSFRSLPISKSAIPRQAGAFSTCDALVVLGAVLRISDVVGRSDIPTQCFGL